MSRFLAVLKDTYREAVATWAVPLMLVFAALLAGVVASLSFRPLTLMDAVERQVGPLNWAFRLDPNLAGTGFAVENASATNPAEPWASGYALDVVFRSARADIMESIRFDPALPVSRGRAEAFVRRIAPTAADVTAADLSPKPDRGKPPAELRFRVTTKPPADPDRLAWPHAATVLFALDWPFPVTLREGVYKAQKQLVNDVGAWVLVLVGVVATAGFVPDALRRGAADLVISKPIGRAELLAYKYVTGVLFVAALAAAGVGGVWLAVGLRTGLWAPDFLLLVPALALYFAPLYAASVLAGTLTRSPLVAIVAALAVWAAAVGAGWGNAKLADADRLEREIAAQVQKRPGADDHGRPADLGDRPWRPPAALEALVRGAHLVLPRAYDLDARAARVIAEGVLTKPELEAGGHTAPLPGWGPTVAVTAAFVVVVVGLACQRFAARDG